MDQSYRLRIEVQSIADICRFVSTFSLSNKTKPLYILAKKQGEHYVYSTALNLYLFSGKLDLLLLYTFSKEKPDRYIRYVDAPVEKCEFTSNMANPIGLYIPIAELASFPKALDPLVNEIILNSDGDNVLSSDSYSIIESSEMFFGVIVLDFVDFVRLILEKKSVNGLSYVLNLNEKMIYFTFGEPYRINDKFYGKIYVTKGPYTDGRFVSIDESGKIAWYRGKRDPALIYASVIRIKSLSESFRKLILSIANLD